MTNEQRELLWKTIGMLWTLSSMKDNPFAEIAADFAEDLCITFSTESEDNNANETL